MNTEKALCRSNIELMESTRFGPKVARTMKEKKNDVGLFFSFSPQIFYRQPRNASGLQMLRCLNSAAQFKGN